MSKNDKSKKITFTEKTDSAINGYALGITFLGVGVFLFFKPDYFFYPMISYIIGAIIGGIGFIGTGIELSKSADIKGIDSLIAGIVLFSIWAVMYIIVATWWANILFFLFFLLGTYAIVSGLIQGVYSIIYNAKSKSINAEPVYKKSSIASQIILFLTQIMTLIVAVLNVVKAINT